MDDYHKQTTNNQNDTQPSRPMSHSQLVVLMGGSATRLSPVSFTLPKGLLPINQKPAIFQMLIDYIKLGLNDITFVTSPSNHSTVKSFLDKTFGNLNIRYIIQQNPKGPLEAFQLCEKYITKSTLLLLGDTLCETDLDYSYDWLGYMNITDKSHSRWCLIKTDADENIQTVIDKPDYTPETNKVLIGLYNFTDAELLKEALNRQYQTKRGELQLSSVIEYYMSKRKMQGLLINSWDDTGTLKDYNDTLRKKISCREFNSLKLDEFGVITKTSTYSKINSEIMWLKKIQKSELNFLIPHFISCETSGDKISYKSEYINGSTLAEYFVYYDIPDSNWTYIINKFFSLGKLLWAKKAPKNSHNIVELAKNMYLDKTVERIKSWKRTDILSQEYVYCNGEKLLGINDVMPLIEPKIKKLIETSKKHHTLIHGDLCFSNVIYLPSISTFKLLDPRGNFGVDTVFGDTRYDVAKIRHCYHGLYDYITQGLYSFEEISQNRFEYKFLTSKIVNPDVFDDILVKNGFDVDQIELIEGLLFISMIPLHNEDKNAQLMYYLTGLKCLNNQLKNL